MGVVTRRQAAGGSMSPTAIAKSSKKVQKLPVTLLSGFLGSGKTTLLRHVLRNKEELKCAIIVNDMAEINIDASLIKNVSLVQAEEKLVEMQNGCICCTLREDLIQEVTKLAQQGSFDYLLIESTGISEPMQVAETFDIPVEGKALKDIAKLDTCVTVVDASNLYCNLNSIQKVKERDDGKKESDEDERNIADLLIDQIEFADVILLNKTDLVSERQLADLKTLIKSLNPGADLIPTKESKVAVKEIVGTGKFDLDKAQRSAGWLQSLLSDAPLVPETEEYGIASFVYRSRKPFHPQRLWKFVNDYFLVEQPEILEHDHEHEGEECEAAEGEEGEAAEGEEGDKSGDEEMTDAEKDEDESAMDAVEVTAKQQEFHAKFGQVLRAKGFFWLAGRDNLGGEWSQAGAILRLTMGAPWFAALPKEAWPEVNQAEVLKDFMEGVGDRRQELVFIGQGIKKEALVAALEACQCTDKELEKVTELEDPFMQWPDFQLEYEEVTDDEEEDADAEGEEKI